MGKTPGCPGCIDTTQEHLPECRERFRSIFEQSDDPRLLREAERLKMQTKLVESKESDNKVNETYHKM